MKIVGLITEYNPFHNGHKYHIEEALRITHSDAAIVVMSGDFVQRGTPAIMPKHLRARMALTCGAALVLELPVYYATGSAEYFAMGAVSILNALNCVDSICFGSECGDIDKLQELAAILSDEPVLYQSILQSYLRQGIAFPSAREQAIADYTNDPELASILSSPNNILAIEYLKAMIRLNSKMSAYTITREGAGYHDDTVRSKLSSASAIRKALLSNQTLETLSEQLPSSVLCIMDEAYATRYPVTENDFSVLLKYRLLGETKESLCEYQDVTPDLANRIINRRNDFLSWTQFCELLKTKELTYARISRVLLHILLNMKKSYSPKLYGRILGFRRDKSEILKTIKNESKIPLISKLNKEDYLELDTYASDLYESVVTDIYSHPFINEYQKQIEII